MASDRTTTAPDIGILLAARPAAKAREATLGVSAMLLPLQERPLLQRAVEHLVRSGCRHLHVALGDDAAALKDFLQTGERWGCQVRYHYLDPQESLGRFMRRLGLDPAHRYWLADAMRVPLEPLPALADPGSAAGQPLCWSDGAQQRWTGWGLYAGAFLADCGKAPADQSFETLMLDAGGLSPHTIERPLSAATLADLLDGSRRLLSTQANQVVMGRNSRIDPKAKIIAPVFIGAHVKVAAGAVVGPNVAIESGAFIDQGAHLDNSIVMSDTYVGEELELHGTIVRGRLLANIALNVVTEVPDPNLLAELTPDGQAPAHAVLAGALRLALAPLYWASRWLTRSKRESEPQGLTDHFCRSFYPGLRDVMRGHLQFIGPTPRSAHVVRQLRPEWRDLYGEYRCGLLNEGLLQAATTAEDQFASDALACASQGDLRATLKLLRRYLGLLLRDLCNAGPASLTRSAATAPFGASGENARITHRSI